ncbi:hypothetical protein K474DRAFT_1701321 [Panus rudis PR-1116 ss-1]|nr:hypothetical protein K474DRAFT_1701321 [Panus rudis PR-1116 ss-1]
MSNPPKKPRLHDHESCQTPGRLLIESDREQLDGKAYDPSVAVIERVKSELSHGEGGFVPGYPVIDFVRHVWGFFSEQIPQGKTGYVLEAHMLHAYQTSDSYIRGKAYGGEEHSCCEYFVDIFNKMVKLLQTNQEEASASLSQSTKLNAKLHFRREWIPSLDDDDAGDLPDFALVRKGSLENCSKELYWLWSGIVAKQKEKAAKTDVVPLQTDVIIDPGVLLSIEDASFVAPGNDVQPQEPLRGEKSGPEFIVSKPTKGIISAALEAITASEETVPFLNQRADRDHSLPVCNGRQSNEIPRLETGNPDELTIEEVQIISYLTELLSYGIRQYATGFLVDDQCISLWYADRYGVIKSARFNWIQEPHYFLLVVAAVLFASPEQLGFSPFMDIDPVAPEENPYSTTIFRIPGGEVIDTQQYIPQGQGKGGQNRQSCHKDQDQGNEAGKESEEVEYTSRDGDYVKKEGQDEDRMPTCGAKAEEGTKPKPCIVLDSDGKEIKETLHFAFDVSPQRRIVTQRGIIGRGTTVIPVKVAGNQVTAKAMRVEGEIPLVAKLAWQYVDRKEDVLIRAIRRTPNIEADTESPSMLTHIVDLKCSLSLSIDSPFLHLPRAFMNRLPCLTHEDLREFRVLILEAYEPLDNLNTVEDFKKVFIETFKAHHWVWTKAEVLHRDISVYNIMFRRRNGGVEGVLCDWDLAATKTYLGEPDDYTVVTPEDIERRRPFLYRPPSARPHVINTQPGSAVRCQRPHTQASTQNGINADGESHQEQRCQPRPRYRTGTGPFMAFELLANPPDRAPIHRYSFDVQSFFYVLVWIAVSPSHNPDNDKVGRIPEWVNPDLKDTYSAKLKFLLSEDLMHNEILERVRPPFTRWVALLYEKMADAACVYLAVRKLRSDLIYAIITNDTKRIEATRKKLKKSVKELDEAITYEGFLAVFD